MRELTPFLLAVLIHPLAVSAPASVELSVRDGLISIESQGAPLGDVLRAIGRRTGIETVIYGELTAPVTRSLVRIPVAQALRQLAGDAVLVMTYRPVTGDEASRRLHSVWVYERAFEPRRGVQRRVSRGDPATRATTAKPDGGIASGQDEVLAGFGGLDQASRIRRVGQLAARGDPSAIAALGAIFFADEDPAVRARVVEALGEIGGEPVIEALAVGLGDEEPGIRGQVVDVLGAIGGDHAVRNLGQVLFSEPDPDIRALAVQYLSNQRGLPARFLLRAAAEDRDARVRRLAEQALQLRPEDSPGH